MENVIFYFSGTGNSLQAAKDIAEKLGNCEVVNLAKVSAKTEISAERVGIVFPVYFWGIPNIVSKFLSEVKVNGTPYIFSVATCGSTKGAALVQVNDLLKQQNQRLSAGFVLKMPGNYIVMYGAQSEEKQRELFQNEKDTVKKISEIVSSKKENIPEKSSFALDVMIGKAISRAAAPKFPSGDVHFTVSDSCIGCGKCEKACSVNNLTMINGRPSWNHHCECCMGCIQVCPVSAINYGNKTQKRKRYWNPNIAE